VNASGDIEAVYRAESRRVLATLIRLLGDFDLAEEALQDAFIAAADQWPREGIPTNPRAWLVSAGRFKAIDRLRRRARFDASIEEIARRLESEMAEPEPPTEDIEDDRLRLIFTCCHPALPADSQVALTLREVCGLTTEEIARAFLARTPAIAQRIVRAKAAIRKQHLPYSVPAAEELPARLEAVLGVIYLVFNEGYAATSGDSVTRQELSDEAIRVGRLVHALLPDPEVTGLLAMMLLHDARRPARTLPNGDFVPLGDQDRSLWNRTLATEGAALAADAFASGTVGPYAIQAAIAAVHMRADSTADTDWAEIVRLYDLLMRAAPSPVVELNRAAAVAQQDGPAAALALVDAILARGDLGDYAHAHSARADVLRRMGKVEQARAAYERALELTAQGPDRRFLERRLAALAT
jgi:RNA polymerase sigma-70 factor (ECF subfamily)